MNNRDKQRGTGLARPPGRSLDRKSPRNIRPFRRRLDKNLPVNVKERAKNRISPRSVIIIAVVILAAYFGVKKIMDCNGDGDLGQNLPSAASGVDGGNGDDNDEEKTREGASSRRKAKRAHISGEENSTGSGADSGQPETDEEKSARLLKESCLKLGGYSDDRTGIYEALKRVTFAVGEDAETMNRELLQHIAAKCRLRIAGLFAVLGQSTREGNTDTAQVIFDVIEKQCDSEADTWEEEENKRRTRKISESCDYLPDSDLSLCVGRFVPTMNEECGNPAVGTNIACRERFVEGLKKGDCTGLSMISPKHQCRQTVHERNGDNAIWEMEIEGRKKDEMRADCQSRMYEEMQSDRELVQKVLIDAHVNKMGTAHMNIINPESVPTLDELNDYAASFYFLTALTDDFQVVLNSFGMRNATAFQVRFYEEVVRALEAKPDKKEYYPVILEELRRHNTLFLLPKVGAEQRPR